MRSHAVAERLVKALQRCERYTADWAGVVFRSASVRYANRNDLLTGTGSKTAGARWNAPGSVATVYASLEIQTAVEEALAHHRYYGFPVETALPRVLVSIQARLHRVLDLSDRAVCRSLGVTRSQLLEDDWRAANKSGKESLTQTIGRLAWRAQMEALLVPSAASARGTNLVVFPGNLLPPQSYLLIINREQLPAAIQ